MISLLWHVRGIIHFDPARSDGEILEILRALLLRGHYEIVSSDQKSINAQTCITIGMLRKAFDLRSMLKSRRDTQLMAVDMIKLSVERDSATAFLRYELRLLHTLIATILLLFFAGVLSAMRGDFPDIPPHFALFAFLWLYGGNLMMTLFRAPGLLRSAVLS